MRRALCWSWLVVVALFGGACARSTTPTPPVDGGLDAAVPRDAGRRMRDARPPDARRCADEDRDGHPAVSCGGDDCDDTSADVSPSMFESCNGGVDDDCNGLADGADGVCVPCPVGYSGVDDACLDVDECASRGEDCDRDPGACVNVAGSFVCACPPGFAGSGYGPMGCLLTDPSLSALVPSSGVLGPAFVGTTTTYRLTLPPGTMLATLAPSVVYPSRATITVDGVVIGSGASSPPITLEGFTPVTVTVTVTTETGASRAYRVVVVRGSTYIKASNTDEGDLFGAAVALSADGSTLAVGAQGEDSAATRGIDPEDDTAAYAGAVYVFTRTGATWSQQAYVKASDIDPFDSFGVALALSADGSTLAVGAEGEDSRATGVGGDQRADGLTPDAGAVYVFTRAGATWSQQAYVKASNTDGGDGFGRRVALSADGATLAVGAPNEDSRATGVDGDQANDSADGAGAVYVFARSAATWSQRAYVKASNADAHDGFGFALALSADGSTLAVGAAGEESRATGIDGDQADDSADAAGAVYVFARSAATWSQQAYVKASNTGARDQFGISVSLSADGSTLAVGAEGEASRATGLGGDEADDSAANAGAAYVFTRTGATWSQQAYVKASNAEASDGFGFAVSLSADGSTLVVAPGRGEASGATGIGGDQADNSTPSAGAAYVFTRTGTAWSQRAYVKASNTDTGDLFAGGPDPTDGPGLSADGSTLAFGALGESSSATGIGGDQADDSAPHAGAVYVY